MTLKEPCPRPGCIFETLNRQRKWSKQAVKVEREKPAFLGSLSKSEYRSVNQVRGGIDQIFGIGRRQKVGKETQ